MAKQRNLGAGDTEVIADAIGLASNTDRGIPSSNKGANYDAFGRLRVSSPLTIFDSKQIADNQPLFFDDAEVSGGGTNSTYNTNQASTTLSVAASTAGVRVRQTFRRFNYQPSKSQLVFCTFVFGSGGDGIIKRVGYFDDDNGVFLEQNAGQHYFVIRSNVTGSPVDTKVSLNEANLNAEFYKDLDFTKTQILIMDMEWLGVGSVRFGFVVDGIIYYLHSFNHANNLNTVYMSTPNLPIRCEIRNDGTGGANNLTMICCSVNSEGGVSETGLTRTISRGSAAFVASSNNVWYPLISLRLKSAYKGITIYPVLLSEVPDSASIYEVALFLNPTIGGIDGVSWVNLTNSAVQYDISRDNTNTLTNGTNIFSAVKEVTNQGANIAVPVGNLLTIGTAIDGTPDEMVFAFRKLSGGATNVYANMTWYELG